MPARRRRRDPVARLLLGLVCAGVVGLGLVELSGSWEGFAPFEGEPSPTLEPAEPEGQEVETRPAYPTPDERVRVEVLNGAGIPGLAGRARDRLRDMGFDVVYFGNAPSFDHETSSVVDRVGDPDGARRVARALDLGAVTSDPDPELLVDVTVVLGADWQPGSVAEEESPGTYLDAGPNVDGVPWWDPRRIFRNP